jgi:hypothetical protein
MSSPYIYVRHTDNGTVSRVLRPEAYRERVQTHDAVVPGQHWAAIVFEPSVRARPDPDAVYGLLQVTGCFANEEECLAFIRKRVLASDRLDEYLMMPCGTFVPLSTAPAALQGVELVDLEKKLHGDYRSAQEQRERREAEEMAKRQQKLQKEQEEVGVRTDTSIVQAEKADDLTSYVRIRVARASARAAVHRMEKQVARIREMQRKLDERAQHFETVVIEKHERHPAYRDDYVQVYADTLIAALTTARDDDDDADYNYIALPGEEPVQFSKLVNGAVRERFLRQSHECDDGEQNSVQQVVSGL